MRTVRNITVAVDPELYRQTRRLAAEYNTSVTDRLRFLLLAMPEALRAAHYPGGRPQFGSAAARAPRAAAAAQTPVPLTDSPSVTSANTSANSQISARTSSTPNSFPTSQIGPTTPLFSSNANSSCKNVKPTQTTCFQPLAALQSAILQILYFSTPLITKTLRASETREQTERSRLLPPYSRRSLRPSPRKLLRRRNRLQIPPREHILKQPHQLPVNPPI
jgi:hypothetical protein